MSSGQLPGIVSVTWQHETFVLADAALVDDGRLQLADVVVQPPQRSVTAAARLAQTTLYELTGCTFVVVAITGGGWLVRGRDAVVPGDGWTMAALAYILLVLNRASRPATSAAIGSPSRE